MLRQEEPKWSKTRHRSRDSSEFDFETLLDTHRSDVFGSSYIGVWDTGLDRTGSDAAKSAIYRPQRTQDWKSIAPINCPVELKHFGLLRKSARAEKTPLEFGKCHYTVKSSSIKLRK